MTEIDTGSAVTDDAVLGGRLRLLQPRRGHRVGHDAILLAAATEAENGERAVEFGAGVGAAGLAVALRVPGLEATLLEIDPALAALACDNAARNGLADRVNVACLDITDRAACDAARLGPASVDRILMNPPFNDPTRQNVSPDGGRRLAHVAGEDTLKRWLASAARLLRPQGVVTLIWRADGLADVLDGLARDFGGVAVRPVYPREGEPAIRILVAAVKGSRAPLALLPGLVLAGADGRPAAAAEAVLRDGAVLPLSGN